MQKQPLKIFQSCCGFLKAGGVESLLVYWYKNTNPHQISMDFGASCSNKADFDFISYVQKRGNFFLVGRGPNWILQKIFHLADLYKLLKKNKYDIFQYNGVSGSFLFLESWVARLAGVKRRYLLVHSPSFESKIPFYRKLARWNLFHAHTHFLAVSELAGKSFYGNKIPFTVVHPGIHISAFGYRPEVREQMRTKLNLSHNFVIGHVGRLALEKNHLFLLEIFNEIYKRNSSARLILVGAGPEEQTIRQKASQLQLEKQILFTGLKKETAPYYQCFDTFVMPSSYEGFGLVALEAQTAGLPCFVADTLPQEIQVCNTTRISLCKNAAVWAEKILTTFPSFIRKDQTDCIRQAGFDINDTIKKLENLYLQAL